MSFTADAMERRVLPYVNKLKEYINSSSWMDTMAIGHTIRCFLEALEIPSNDHLPLAVSYIVLLRNSSHYVRRHELSALILRVMNIENTYDLYEEDPPVRVYSPPPFASPYDDPRLRTSANFFDDPPSSPDTY